MFSHGIRSSLATGLHRLFFVEPGVKANGAYYRDVLLNQKVLQVIRHNVRKLLRLSAGQRSSTSGSGHCCIATSGDCRIDWTRTLASKITRPQSGWLQYLWFDIQERIYQTSIRNIDDLNQCLVSVWSNRNRASWTRQSISGALACQAERLCSCQGKALRSPY